MKVNISENISQIKIFNIINIGYQRLSNNWKKIKIEYKEKLKESIS